MVTPAPPVDRVLAMPTKTRFRQTSGGRASDTPIFVTGGAGFVGSSFVRRALAKGRKVTVLDRFSYAGQQASLSELEGARNLSIVVADIRDPNAVRAALRRHQPSTIVHLAAETHVDRSIDGPEAFVSTNVTGTRVLLDESLAWWRGLHGIERDEFRFLHISTDEVFGSADEGTQFDENSPYNPSSPYAASKAAADHLVRAWNRTYGLPVMITHSANNYGPFQFPEKLIPHMILRALRSETLPLYGDGGNVRDWIHVEDHCAALETVLERGIEGASYCITAAEPRTNLEIIQELCKILDREIPRDQSHAQMIRFVEDRPAHDKRYATNPSRIRELDWRPTVTLSDGLQRTLRWYLEHRPWWEHILRGGYGLERAGMMRV